MAAGRWVAFCRTTCHRRCAKVTVAATCTRGSSRAKLATAGLCAHPRSALASLMAISLPAPTGPSGWVPAVHPPAPPALPEHHQRWHGQGSWFEQTLLFCSWGEIGHNLYVVARLTRSCHEKSVRRGSSSVVKDIFSSARTGSYLGSYNKSQNQFLEEILSET